MTSRELTQTNLIIGVLYPLYSMIDEDIAALAADLRRQVVAEYGRTVQQQLNLYGCQRLATPPDAVSQRWIDAYLTKTSEGIARTYNTQLRNEIERLYQANPRGNRYYYMRALETWTQRRNAYKIPSIALNAKTAAAQYARQRFRDENGIQGRFVFVGPPPVCKRCMKLKGLGPVSEEQATKYGDSQHVNCPHFWQQLINSRIDCANAWTG